jgi:hypothetical protein
VLLAHGLKAKRKGEKRVIRSGILCQMKKLLFILLFTGLLPYGCFCPELSLNYMRLKGFELSLYQNNQQELVAGSSLLPSDELGIRIEFTQVEYIASVEKCFFSASAYATSCENEGGLGRKSRIDSLTIRSDKLFNGKQPGESLNNYFTGTYFISQNQESTAVTADADALVNYLNESRYHMNSGYLTLKTNPQDNSSHRFTIRIVLEDQTAFERETEIITFGQ